MPACAQTNLSCQDQKQLWFQYKVMTQVITKSWISYKRLGCGSYPWFRKQKGKFLCSEHLGEVRTPMFLSQVNQLGTVLLLKLNQMHFKNGNSKSFTGLSDILMSQCFSSVTLVVPLSGWYWFARAPFRNSDVASLCSALFLPLCIYQAYGHINPKVINIYRDPSMGVKVNRSVEIV